MKIQMTWKTKLIIAVIIIALVLSGLGIVSSMSYGKLLLAVVSWFIGLACGWYAKYIYDKYFKQSEEIKE